jgi:hypothetical protein
MSFRQLYVLYSWKWVYLKPSLFHSHTHNVVKFDNSVSLIIYLLDYRQWGHPSFTGKMSYAMALRTFSHAFGVGLSCQIGGRKCQGRERGERSRPPTETLSFLSPEAVAHPRMRAEPRTPSHPGQLPQYMEDPVIPGRMSAPVSILSFED